MAGLDSVLFVSRCLSNSVSWEQLFVPPQSSENTAAVQHQPQMCCLTKIYLALCMKYEVYCQYFHAIYFLSSREKWIIQIDCTALILTRLCLSCLVNRWTDMNRFSVSCCINPVRDADYFSVCFQKIFITSWYIVHESKGSIVLKKKL